MSVSWTGTSDIRADVPTVWAALNDAACLASCVPGCRDLVGIAPDRFQLSVGVEIGPVGLVLRGVVRIVGAQPCRCLRLSGQGRAGPMGGGAGRCRIVLEPSRVGCRVRYEVEAHLDGPLALFGALAIPVLARAMTRSFAANFKRIVEARSIDEVTAVGARPARAPRLRAPSAPRLRDPSAPRLRDPSAPRLRDPSAMDKPPRVGH